MTGASFGITTHMTYQRPFWIWIRICVKFSFFITLSILHIETCIIPLKKAVFKGLISFLHLSALNNLWGRYDPKTEKANIFAHNRVISSHRIMCNASIESFIQTFISFSYTDNLGTIYWDAMTKKHENLMIYGCFQ